MAHTPPSLMLAGDSPRVRESDPVTSHEAADSNDFEGSRAVVMWALGEFGPSADHETIAHHRDYAPVPYTDQRLRTARAELVEDGAVEFAGFYRRTDRNRRTRVWQLVASVAAAAVAAVLLVGCSSISEGTITGKDAEPGYFYTTTLCTGKPIICYPITNYIPPSWKFDLKLRDKTGWVYVDQTTFENFEVGDYYYEGAPQ